MDLRPQGPEIIRTWLFATALRAHYEHDVLPWHTATINGWILDPDRKKMSKSRGNVVTPSPLIEEHGAEAVRYWACNGRPGVDTAVDYGVMKIGRRLAIKILNASRFALGFSSDDVDPSAITEPVDRSVLAALAMTVAEATEAFEQYDYARALEVAEQSFWSWTDDYLELVKGRAYGEGAAAASAHASLQVGLGVYLRLFAPFLPFVTEEVWSWWREGSVHRQPWPAGGELSKPAGDPEVMAVASVVLESVRRVKSEAKVSMKAELDPIVIVHNPESIERLRLVESDLIRATGTSSITYEEGDFAVAASLADTG
jgi:valyl-tRNA synthetase